MLNEVITTRIIKQNISTAIRLKNTLRDLFRPTIFELQNTVIKKVPHASQIL